MPKGTIGRPRSFSDDDVAEAIEGLERSGQSVTTQSVIRWLNEQGRARRPRPEAVTETIKRVREAASLESFAQAPETVEKEASESIDALAEAFRDQMAQTVLGLRKKLERQFENRLRQCRARINELERDNEKLREKVEECEGEDT